MATVTRDEALHLTAEEDLRAYKLGAATLKAFMLEFPNIDARIATAVFANIVTTPVARGDIDRDTLIAIIDRALAGHEATIEAARQ